MAPNHSSSKSDESALPISLRSGIIRAPTLPPSPLGSLFLQSFLYRHFLYQGVSAPISSSAKFLLRRVLRRRHTPLQPSCTANSTRTFTLKKNIRQHSFAGAMQGKESSRVSRMIQSAVEGTQRSLTFEENALPTGSDPCISRHSEQDGGILYATARHILLSPLIRLG